MKLYEKPFLSALPLTGNDQLAGSCSPFQDTSIDDSWIIGLMIAAGLSDKDMDPDGNGTVTRQEFENVAKAKELFGDGENCKNIVTGYCKFTATATTLAWS